MALVLTQSQNRDIHISTISWAQARESVSHNFNTALYLKLHYTLQSLLTPWTKGSIFSNDKFINNKNTYLTNA